MRFDELKYLPANAVSRLESGRVQEYARATGWKLEPRLGRGLTAVYERPESRLLQFSVPLTQELQDYNLLMGQTVCVIAHVEERPALELLTELLFPPSDLLKFAESSLASAAGDVPLEHGRVLLDGARKTILAAACSAIHPLTFLPRRSLTEAKRFLRQCRLGQTERSSFVLTIACPLDAVPPNLSDNTGFTRRVTELLMRSLHRLATALDLGAADSLLQEAESEPVLSANLCEGLLDMAPEGEGAFLQVTAGFSRMLSQAGLENVPKTVRLGREVFPRIEYLAARLHPTPNPRGQVFMGLVETLNGRPNGDSRPEGEVGLRVFTPENEILRARAELNADDYARADQAHMQNVPVSLEGVLRQAGRLFRIDQVSHFTLVRPAQTPAGGTS